jgi:uncharacterized membrane protein (DUF4010 family)
MGSDSFSHVDVATRIALTLAVGFFVGLEREWAQKEVGVRTFSIVALFGTLVVLLAPRLMPMALAGTFLLVLLMNLQSLMSDASLEMTTSASLLVTLILGGLIGQGHYFTAVTSAILMTMLLAWKEGLTRFAGGLQPDEIRSAVLLGLLSFVVYPLLPDRFVDPWQLLNPRQAWIMVVVIASLGFTNYVMLRLYGARGTYYSAFLGGLVNSTAAATELSTLFKGAEGSGSLAIAVIMVTSVAMFLRNLVILAIFAPSSVSTALLPLGAMTVAALCAVWLQRDRSSSPPPQLRLASPVSLPHVIEFAALFVALSASGALAQRYFGGLGFLAMSVFGGLVSSASMTATAAALVAGGRITPQSAGMGVVLTSMASVMVDMPIVYRQIREKSVSGRLAIASSLVIGLGLCVMVFAQFQHQTIEDLAARARYSVQQIAATPRSASPNSVTSQKK